jgi:membrane-bound lytic murein transglycosylase MltF
MVDRWFLAVEQSMSSLSRFLLSIVEKVYSSLKEKEKEVIDKKIIL